ncbi:MAG TPA: PAS domain-containing protein, partial [Vampirovibrionales bacterium]
QDFTHPDDLDTAATLLAQLTAGEISLSSLDKRCLRVDGSEIWIHVEMSLVRNGQGAAEYLIAIVDDIDQRKRMEESLRISEHRLAQAQAIANIGVWQWDIRANKTYWSEETFKIFGVPQGSIEPDAETFFQLLHPDDVAIAQDNIQRLFAGEHMPQSEYRIITPAGELKVLQDYHELIRDQQGEPIYISGAVQDITEMRQTMIALQESEARLAQSQAIAHLGHWEWNLVTNTLLWSDEFYRIFDLEPQATEPKFETFIEMVHAGDRHRIEAAIEILKRGEKVYGFEYRITTAQGREKIVLEHVAPLYNDAGEVTHFSGTLQDITAFKQTLNALQASETRLAKSQAIAHVGSWEWDLATNRIIWSDENYRIFDFEPQSVEPSYDLVMGMV